MYLLPHTHLYSQKHLLGHLLPPLPLNVGPQDGIDTLVINNIGRGRGVNKHLGGCSGEVSQLIMSGSVGFKSYKSNKNVLK